MKSCIVVCPNGHEFPAIADFGGAVGWFRISKTLLPALVNHVRLFKLCPICNEKLVEQLPTTNAKETMMS